MNFVNHLLGPFNFSDLFASMPGIVGAVVGTLGSVILAVFGVSKDFKLPFESAPGFSRGFLNFILFIPFCVSFAFINPGNAYVFLLVSLLGVPAAWAMMGRFGKAFANHRFTRPVPTGFWFWKGFRDGLIVGGDKLTPLAEQKAKAGETIQDILKSAEYDPDAIWVRESRTEIQQRIELSYYLFFFFAVTFIVVCSLSLQALITDTAPLDSAKKLWREGHADAPMPPR